MAGRLVAVVASVAPVETKTLHTFSRYFNQSECLMPFFKWLSISPPKKDKRIMKHSGQSFQGFNHNLIHWNPARFHRLGFPNGDRPLLKIDTGPFQVQLL
jgi:hypothetical protein